MTTEVSTSRQLGGRAALLLGGNVFTLVVGLPLQIYVARTLGAAELGIFGLIEATMMMLADLLSLGVAATLVRFIPEYRQHGRLNRLRSLLRRGLSVIAILGAVGLAVALLGGAVFWDRLAISSRHWPIFVLMATLVPLTLCAFALQQALRGFMDLRITILGQSVLQLTVKASVAVLLLSTGFGLAGYCAAVVLANLFAAVWLAAGLRRRVAALPPAPDAEPDLAWRDWISYAAYNYLGVLAEAATTRLDRFVLGYLHSAAAVGVAGVVTTLNALPTIFLRVTLAAASPMFTELNAKGDRKALKHLYHVATDWIMRAVLPLALYLIVFARPLLELFGPEFAEAGRLPLALLVAGQVVNLAAGPSNTFLNVIGYERAVFRIALSVSLASVLGLFVLIPAYGLAGWAALNLAVNLAYFAIGTFALRQLVGFSWWDPRYGRWLLPAGASLLLLLGLSAMWPDAGPVGLAAALALCYGVFAAITLLQGLNAEDRDLIAYLLARLGLQRAAE
jgi:O-antigen/teichoic acid export membrane protein